MYINSMHIKIVKLIQNYENITIEELCDTLLLNDFTLRNYLSDIKKFLKPIERSLSIQDLINKIFNNKNLIFNLRKNQVFTKQEKIDYLSFKLLISDVVNLSKLSQEIEVNRRTLNYYLIEIKEKFSYFKINISNCKNGIFLKTANYQKSRILYLTIFKLGLEKSFLSYKFRKLIFKFIHKSNLKHSHKHKKMYKEMCSIVSPIFSRYNFITFSCMYLAFHNFKGEKTIKNLNNDHLLRYKPLNFEKDKYFKIMDLLKLTPLGDLQPIYLDFLFLNLFFCTYNCKSLPKPILKKTLDIKPYIYDFIGSEKFDNDNYINIAGIWVYYAFIKEHLKIFDFYHSITGLNLPNTLKVQETIKNIRKHIPLFSKFDLFFIFHSLKKNQNTFKKNKIMIYDKIPKKIITHIVEDLQIIHNINIYKIIHINDFYKFDKKDLVESVITVENLNIKGPYKIINYDIPF